MSEWKIKEIRKIGSVITGKTPPKDQDKYFIGDHLFVSPKDLNWDTLYIFDTETKISKEALDKFKNQVIPRNAIMYTSLSFAFGKIGIASESLLTNQQIHSIVVNYQNNFRFVYYLLRANRPLIFSYNSGIDTPIVPKSVFEKIELKIPPLPVQKKIAAILSAYDDLIEKNNRRIAILEKMAEEIYREWFVRLRFPGHEQVKFNKGIPEGWEVVKIGKIANIVMGQSPKSEFYNQSGDGLPFNQGVGTYGDRFPKRETYCSVQGRIANEGDILFSVRAPVGRLNIADCKMIIGRGLAAINHKKGYNSYLFYLLEYYFSNEDIIGNGSIFNSVGKDELESVKILLPNKDFISRYNNLVKPIDTNIENIYKLLNILKQTRDRLLTRLISGKLSVENLDIQFSPSMIDI